MMCPSCGCKMVLAQDPMARGTTSECYFCPDALNWLLFNRTGPHAVEVWRNGAPAWELGIVREQGQ